MNLSQYTANFDTYNLTWHIIPKNASQSIRYIMAMVLENTSNISANTIGKTYFHKFNDTQVRFGGNYNKNRFAVVRNPAERLLSCYSNIFCERMERTENLDYFFNEFMPTILSYNHNNSLYEHFYPQYMFLTDKNIKVFNVDSMYKVFTYIKDVTGHQFDVNEFQLNPSINPVNNKANRDQAYRFLEKNMPLELEFYSGLQPA